MTMIIVFSFIFLASVVGISFIITRKIPLVLETPREVVNDYFDQGSSRAHIRVLRIRSWIRRGAYWGPLLAFSARAIRRLRVVLFKIDQYSFSLLQNVKEKSEERKEKQALESDPRYWEELRSVKRGEDQGGRIQAADAERKV
ncbi:MAG: hypothetical protein UY64_C0027G0001 [Parcubacteria group bacterium GW2011_GWA1_51_12]|nr:MAG: hypothetical protein UY64_C0027G0001 [Parcubacteria group bacterium GW2011_GWA1_51_12]